MNSKINSLNVGIFLLTFSIVLLGFFVYLDMKVTDKDNSFGIGRENLFKAMILDEASKKYPWSNKVIK